MKKTAVITLLLLFLCTTCFAECNLDVNRWERVSSKGEVVMFFDKESIIYYPTSNERLVWTCYYFPNGAGNDKGEHYVYTSVLFNYNNREYLVKTTIRRDANDKVEYYSNYEYGTIPRPLLPESNMEYIFDCARKISGK